MTTTHGVPMPFSPYIVSEWTGPEMIDRKTWTAYTADQVRDTAIKYADARCAHFEAAMQQILEERGFRSDGDADVLVQRIRDMSIEDRDVIACAQGNFTEMKQRRDALAEKAKAMEDELDHAIRVLSKTCRWPDCNCPQSMGTGHLHCERQPIHVIEPSKQGAEAERDALAEKVKAMEGLARRALKCLREEVVPLEQDSIDIINSTIIDFQSVLYATPVDAAIDAAGGDQC